MKLHRRLLLSPMLFLVAAAASAQAGGEGLVARAADWLWPQVQARITVQTAAPSPLSLSHGSESAARRTVQGGALLGDYVFATPSFGSFRATSGVVLGAPAGAPMANSTFGPRVGVTLLETVPTAAPGGDGPNAMPYLGLGYASPAFWGSLSVSADFGLVAGRPSGFAGVGRALLGNQPFDGAIRDLRLAPMLQVGVRYTF